MELSGVAHLGQQPQAVVAPGRVDPEVRGVRAPPMLVALAETLAVGVSGVPGHRGVQLARVVALDLEQARLFERATDAAHPCGERGPGEGAVERGEVASDEAEQYGVGAEPTQVADDPVTVHLAETHELDVHDVGAVFAKDLGGDRVNGTRPDVVVADQGPPTACGRSGELLRDRYQLV